MNFPTILNLYDLHSKSFTLQKHYFFHLFFLKNIIKALSFGVITAKYDADLSTIRDSIIQLNNSQVKGKNEDSDGVNLTHHSSTALHLSDSWGFIDCKL
ncbi:unnamed protein product [Trichobilharzia regenti]|nr:unnamed protein product [Trichobilharzia regenti]